MSAANCRLSEDQFLCSICLDVFTDPVSTPCGHNFCKDCITEHWDRNVPYKCPNCKETFHKRPVLKVNTFISQMAAQFRQSVRYGARRRCTEQQAAKPGEVPCDVCTGAKLKALKSCLVCLASYCETHLKPHLTALRLQKHKLIDPVENLEDRMCEKHNQLLDMFCKNDQICICRMCSYSDHNGHAVVPLNKEYERKKAELGMKEAQVQQIIQKKRLKIQELKRSIDASNEYADRRMTEGVQIFAALMESVERSQAEFIVSIKEEQSETEKQAEGFIKELEQEISELEKRREELKQLSRCEDHLQLLQNFTFLSSNPPTKDWTEVRVHPPSYEGTVGTALHQLQETISEQMRTLLATNLRKVQKHEVDVTLDPDTAHPCLILSNDCKQVYCGNARRVLPSTPKRFDACVNLLAEQSFSSGRFYYEVQVKGKTEWDLGVARESINRKGTITLSPQAGIWTIWLRNGQNYEARTSTPVSLSLRSRPEKVGVFVDYEEGLVSFYDVDAAALIYSFTGCSFNEKIYPFFSPCPHSGGANSAPLIITPVNFSW